MRFGEIMEMQGMHFERNALDGQSIANGVPETLFWSFLRLDQGDADIYLVHVAESRRGSLQTNAVFDVYVPHERPFSLPFGLLFDETADSLRQGTFLQTNAQYKRIAHTLRMLQAFVDEGFGSVGAPEERI
jgi:hypothetical protein